MPRSRRPSLLRLARAAWLRRAVAALALMLALGNVLAAFAAPLPQARLSHVSMHAAPSTAADHAGCHAAPAPAKASLPACPCCAADHCACLAGAGLALPAMARSVTVLPPESLAATPATPVLVPAHSSPPLRPPAA